MHAKYSNQSKNACRKPVENYEKTFSKDVKSWNLIQKGFSEFPQLWQDNDHNCKTIMLKYNSKIN